jgi:hypothetical protein
MVNNAVLSEFSGLVFAVFGEIAKEIAALEYDEPKSFGGLIGFFAGAEDCDWDITDSSVRFER